MSREWITWITWVQPNTQKRNGERWVGRGYGHGDSGRHLHDENFLLDPHVDHLHPSERRKEKLELVGILQVRREEEV